MALSVLQSKVTNPVDNADNSSATMDSTPAGGNTVVVCINGWRAAASGGFNMSATGVTDNKGNTYTRVSQSALDSNGVMKSAIFCAFNITSSATFTITVDPDGTGNYFSWSATEVAGATTTDPFDVGTSSTGSSTAASTGTTASTAQANEIIFAVTTEANNMTSITVDAVSPTFNQIYEQLDSVNHIAGEADYRIVSSTGTQVCTWTLNPSSRWTGAIATFKAAADVGGTVSTGFMTTNTRFWGA